MADADKRHPGLNESAEPPGMDEIAYAWGDRDRTRFFIKADGTLQNEDVVLSRYGYGQLDAYEDLLRDDQVKSAFEQRRTAVTGANWTVQSASDKPEDKAAAEFLESQLYRVGWDTVTDQMLYATFYGYGVAELLWDVTPERLWGWRAIKVRRRQRFAFTADGRCYLDLAKPEQDRIYCEQPYFWVVNTGADNSDNPYGLGLAHQLFFPVRFKRDGMRFWLIYLEKFAQPTAVGTFPLGAKAADKAKLLHAVKAVQTEAGVIVPEGMIIDLLEASRSGTPDYVAMVAAMDKAIQKIILGQTLTTEVGSTGGNRALGGVHMAVRQDIVKADADLACETFNRGPVTWLTRYNFPNAQPPRVMREIEQGTDTQALSQELERLHRIGFKPSIQMVRDEWGAEMEEKPPAVIPPGLGGPPVPGAPGTGDAEPSPEFASALALMFPDQDAIDGGLDKFEARMEAIARDMLAPVLDYAASHTPVDTLIAMNGAMPDLSTDQLGEALSRVHFVATTLGRASAAS